MGETNGFVAKFNKVSGALVYSTYLGGGGSDSANGIALDQEGDAYVTGITYSSNFPVTTGAYQSKNNGLSNSASNAFLTELNPAGSGLIYSTYIGGSGISITSGGCGCDGYGVQNINGDSSNGIALGSSGIVYLAGTTSSANFPTTTGSFQPRTGATAETDAIRPIRTLSRRPQSFIGVPVGWSQTRESLFN